MKIIIGQGSDGSNYLFRESGQDSWMRVKLAIGNFSTHHSSLKEAMREVSIINTTLQVITRDGVF